MQILSSFTQWREEEGREGWPGKDRILDDVKLKRFLCRISFKLNEFI